MPQLDEGRRRAGSSSTTYLARVLVLTTFDLDDDVYEALNTGATGFLRKMLTAGFTDLERPLLTGGEGDETAGRVLGAAPFGPVVRRHDGRIVMRLGDGALLTFRQPDDSVVAGGALVDEHLAPAAPGRDAHRRGPRHKPMPTSTASSR